MKTREIEIEYFLLWKRSNKIELVIFFFYAEDLVLLDLLVNFSTAYYVPVLLAASQL